MCINLNLKFSSISPFDLEFHIALTSLTWAWTATEMFTAIPCTKIKESLAWILKPTSGDHSDVLSTGTSLTGAPSPQTFAKFPCHATVPPGPRAGQGALPAASHPANRANPAPRSPPPDEDVGCLVCGEAYMSDLKKKTKKHKPKLSRDL